MFTLAPLSRLLPLILPHEVPATVPATTEAIAATGSRPNDPVAAKGDTSSPIFDYRNTTRRRFRRLTYSGAWAE